MREINQIQKKIEKVEKLLDSIKQDLESLKVRESAKTKRQHVVESLPDEEKLRETYNALYQQFLNNDKSTVGKFVNAKKKVYLNAFCKANSLPISKKASKKEIIKEIQKWFAQKSAIMEKPIIRKT